jgi:predicted nucleotidyltransferase
VVTAIDCYDLEATHTGLVAKGQARHRHRHRAYSLVVTSQLEAALTRAALSGRERRVVERLVARFHEELGEDLHAVWLYGSRARGEADPSETDPDRRSDVDLMIVVDPSRDAGRVSWDIDPLIEEAADAEGDSPVWYSVLVWDTERLRDRRGIRSFFAQEVDRDKIVLAGSALERVAA